MFLLFQGYNIHINGLFHCTVRYKQLLNLHVQLGKELDIVLPEFPPKKLFPLTINQQEERRNLLEKYVQTIGQNSTINCSELLNGFFLQAQQETAGFNSGKEDLNVFLINGYKVTVSASPSDNSEDILNVCIYKKVSFFSSSKSDETFLTDNKIIRLFFFPLFFFFYRKYVAVSNFKRSIFVISLFISFTKKKTTGILTVRYFLYIVFV